MYKFKEEELFGTIYCLCQILMVLVAGVILIKQVFDVMNKNKEVMTLFAMIERDQIEQLKKECDEFKQRNFQNLLNVDSQYSEASEAIESEHSQHEQDEDHKSEDQNKKNQSESVSKGKISVINRV